MVLTKETLGFVGLGHMGGLMHKDIVLALTAARRLDIPLPTAERADEIQPG